jgi:hypothetical protein
MPETDFGYIGPETLPQFTDLYRRKRPSASGLDPEAVTSSSRSKGMASSGRV